MLNAYYAFNLDMFTLFTLFCLHYALYPIVYKIINVNFYNVLVSFKDCINTLAGATVKHSTYKEGDVSPISYYGTLSNLQCHYKDDITFRYSICRN